MAQRPPTLSFAPELLLQAQGAGAGIRAAIFDVDGVLTDGRIYIGEQRRDASRPSTTLDGHGLKLLRAGGIVPIVDHRARLAGGAPARRRPRPRARGVRRRRQARRGRALLQRSASAGTGSP